MKVLHVLHNFPPEFHGGVERYVEQTALAQVSQGLDVTILCGSEVVGEAPAVEEETWEGMRVLRARGGASLRSPVDPFDPSIVPLYEKCLAVCKPDVVHVHHWWNLTDDLVRRAVRRGCATVVTLHDAFSTCSLFFRLPDAETPCDKPQAADTCGPCLAGRASWPTSELASAIGRRHGGFRAELAAAGVRLAPSRAHASAMEGWLGGDLAVEPLPLGSPPLVPVPPPAPRSPDDPLRILHFGNLCRLKGVEVLVEAVRRVVASGRRVDLVLAGKAVEAGLDLEGARVVGPYDATRLRTLAQDADVVVLPSLARESYGLVVDEALRLGLPVIVSDRGALAERIGGRGLAVVAGDVDALAGAISRFADDAAAVASYRAAPLPDLLTPEDHAQSLLVVYRRASDLPRARVDVERPLVNRLRHWGAALSRVMSRPGSRAAGVPKPMPMSASSPIVPRVEVDPAGDLVSVITRTRNRRDFLAESIASVARQTHPRVELVVCNDGGEDVADVLDPFRDRLAITYLEPGRVGRCSAGNIALEHARGTWIAWLDDDDLYYPEHLATLMDTVRTSGHKVAYTDAHQLDMGRAGPDGPWVEVGRSVPYSQDFSRVMLFRQAYIHLVTVLHHRECVERLGGLDPTLEVLEDWDLFFRLAQDYDFKHLARVTAAFRIRDDRSNAVTALRREFVDTRTLLYQRYSHVALPEMLGMVQTGHELIGVLRKRIDDLEARLLPPTEDP